MAGSPWPQVVKPSASTLALLGQKPDLGWFAIRRGENKKYGGTKKSGDSLASPVKSLASSSWRLVASLWPSWEGSYPENVCSVNHTVNNTHHALQRSREGIMGFVCFGQLFLL